MSNERILLILQVFHTLVFIVCIGALLPLAGYAVTGRGLALAAWSLVPPVIVFIGLMLNGWTCILQTWAKRLTGTEDGWARDVLFLPESWATRVVRVMVPVFIIVVGAGAARFATGL